MPAASATLVWSFVALTVVLAGAFVAAVGWVDRADGRTVAVRVRRLAVVTLGTAIWVAGTGGLAAAGQLTFEGRPPTMLILLGSAIALAVGLGVSPLGGRLAVRLPMAVLVGFQGFRVAVEAMIARAYHEGLAPVQMTYHGRNFDVVSGVTALGVACLLVARRVPDRWVRPVVRAWNVLGFGLLANVFVIAVLSAPTPFRVFHQPPANVWITHAPWVWLPTVMVVAAALGHVLVARRLRHRRAISTADSGRR